jgi:hypothetical protein
VLWIALRFAPPLPLKKGVEPSRIELRTGDSAGHSVEGHSGVRGRTRESNSAKRRGQAYGMGRSGKQARWPPKAAKRDIALERTDSKR